MEFFLVTRVITAIIISDLLEARSLKKYMVSDSSISTVQSLTFAVQVITTMPYRHFIASFLAYLKLEKGALFIALPVELKELV